jgi:riboflavin synthase
MFTGIVETIGHITELTFHQGNKAFCITPILPFDDLKLGDSVSINGVCLTITQFTQTSFHVTAVPETLQRTNLNFLNVKESVNIERSLKHGDRIGGHYVQGHVDCVGQVLELQREGSALLVKISLPPHLASYVVNKGYIALDGMSITVISATPNWFTVTLIPHTQAVTITNRYQPGDWINIEVDIMGKYIEKLMQARA